MAGFCGVYTHEFHKKSDLRIKSSGKFNIDSKVWSNCRPFTK